MLKLTPRQIVSELDKYIVGQNEAKRAVAIAIRNRWRRQQVEPEMRKEIGPKNMMMIGPTGVGKTEIVRRLATLTGAPFIKVEATKYTEVGYYGRDVESMVRELVENAIGIVRTQEREQVREKADKAVQERLVNLIITARKVKLQNEGPNAKKKNPVSDDSTKMDSADPLPMDQTLENFFQTVGIKKEQLPPGFPDAIKQIDQILNNVAEQSNANGMSDGADSEGDSPNDSAPLDDVLEGDDFPLDDDASTKGSDFDKKTDERDEWYKSLPQLQKQTILNELESGKIEDELVSIMVSESNTNMLMMGNVGNDFDLHNVLENLVPKQSKRRKVTVSEARKIEFEKVCEHLIDNSKVVSRAIELAENLGIIFIDELDKIIASDRQSGADVSRQGVQRDLLPIVEGTTVQTKYGFVCTDHVLFIGAGAFHRAKPTDLMPELQGRFPIRVELGELGCNDFIRILTEPHGALTKQYIALMKTEGIDVSFTDDAIESLAQYAFEVNQTTQNIGARRLYTIMERLLEELSFEAPDMNMGRVVINAAYVSARLEQIVADDDMNRFIL